MAGPWGGHRASWEMGRRALGPNPGHQTYESNLRTHREGHFCLKWKFFFLGKSIHLNLIVLSLCIFSNINRLSIDEIVGVLEHMRQFFLMTLGFGANFFPCKTGTSFQFFVLCTSPLLFFEPPLLSQLLREMAVPFTAIPACSSHSHYLGKSPAQRAREVCDLAFK